MEELKASNLGTKCYWNDAYKKELDNYHDHNDPGDEWFGRKATKRVVKWIVNCDNISEASYILDIGCGNGLLLLELVKLGYLNVTGVDYCENALELAKEVFKNEGFTEETISWQSLDIVTEIIVRNTADNALRSFKKHNILPVGYTQQIFDVCLDKGTYDAISLNPDNSLQKRLEYIKSLKMLLSRSGFFIIVSCNWTCEELKQQFNEFDLVGEIPAPTFSFGGKQGQTVSTCVFRHHE